VNPAKPIASHKAFEGLTQIWQHDSASTGTAMRFATFTPKGGARACLLWLPDFDSGPEDFFELSGAARALAQHGLMALAVDSSPRGLGTPGERDDPRFGEGASFYVDATTPGYADHYRMESYVSEITQVIEEQLWIGRISIAGHSMGGHGALVAALRAPDRFRSVSALAPIAHPSATSWGQKAFTGFLGPDAKKWAAHDATLLVGAGKKHPREILIDQGTADEFLETQLRTDDFVRACASAGQPLTANLREGYDHGPWFVATFIESHVAFHAAALR
jgi:S-formylglutathione hydrolase